MPQSIIHKLLKEKILLIGYFVLVAASIFFSQVTTLTLADHSYMQYSMFFLIGTISSLALLLYINKHTVLGFHIIDLTVVLFFLVMIVRYIGTNNYYIYSKGAIALAFIPIYFFSRLCKHKNIIHSAIVFNGAFQLVVALFQQIGFIDNINSFFRIGGSFGNPNVLAMVLLISLFSSTYLMGFYKSRTIKYVLIVYSLLSILVLFSTKCRSAILALIVIYIIHLFYKKPWQNGIKNIYLNIVLIVLQVVPFIYLVIAKFDSLTGRILIWKASILKISENPIWGYGVSSFHKIYPNAQKSFLEHSNNTVYDKIAGAPNWVYNDYIELWLEGGVFLAITYMLMLIAVLFCAYKRNMNRHAFYAVVAFFTLGTVNFAYTAWPVLLIFIFNLGVFSYSCNYLYSIILSPKLKHALGLIVVVFILANAAFSIKSVSTLSFLNKIQKVGKLKFDERALFFENNKQYLYYPTFTFKYAAHLKNGNNYNTAIEVLSKSRTYANTYSANIQLANTYMEINALDSAAKYFNEALAIIPSMTVPKLNLLLIERELGKNIKTESIRMELMDSKLKKSLLIN